MTMFRCRCSPGALTPHPGLVGRGLRPGGDPAWAQLRPGERPDAVEHLFWSTRWASPRVMVEHRRLFKRIPTCAPRSAPRSVEPSPAASTGLPMGGSRTPPGRCRSSSGADRALGQLRVRTRAQGPPPHARRRRRGGRGRQRERRCREAAGPARGGRAAGKTPGGAPSPPRGRPPRHGGGGAGGPGRHPGNRGGRGAGPAAPRRGGGAPSEIVQPDALQQVHRRAREERPDRGRDPAPYCSPTCGARGAGREDAANGVPCLPRPLLQARDPGRHRPRRHRRQARRRRGDRPVLRRGQRSGPRRSRYPRGPRPGRQGRRPQGDPLGRSRSARPCIPATPSSARPGPTARSTTSPPWATP